LIGNGGFATATGLAAMMDNEISHDQVTHFLAGKEFNSRNLWRNVS